MPTYEPSNNPLKKTGAALKELILFKTSSGLVVSVLVSALLIFGLFNVATNSAHAKKQGEYLVVFTASWCANCRQVNPIVQSISSERGIPIISIDVDNQSAPSNANDYGLSVPKADLPQVYHVKDGSTTHLYDGRSFSYGQIQALKGSMSGKLP